MRASSAWTRPVVFYFVLVVVPVVAIAALSLDSLSREVRNLRRLADANRRLLAEKFAAEIERAVTVGMDRCLHSAGVNNLPQSSRACPLASQFFLFEDGRLRCSTGGDDPGMLRLADVLRFPSGPSAGLVYPFAFAGGRPAQFFYLRLPGAPPGRVIAARVNLDYVRSVLLPTARATMGILADVVPLGSYGTEPASPFRLIFPFWTVRLRGGQGAPNGYRTLIVYAAMNFMVLLALGASVWQLLRLYSRKWRAAEMRSAVVSRFSHELKTPLANIRLYADLMRNGGGPRPEDGAFADIIAAQAEQLTRRVNRVLDAALIDQGRRKYDLRDADLARIVLQTVERYRDWAAQQGFTLQVDIGPVGAVRCDPDAVAETLVNLLDNAVKYSGSSRLVRVAVRQEADAAVVEVEDHGIGIPVADHERIFEEFYRAPNSKTVGGFGLGLFLARHVMEALGGRIDVESKSGQGSRFRLRFPTNANDPDR